MSSPEQSPEIRGDLVLDRLLGWTTAVLALAVLVLGLVIPHKGAAVSLAEVASRYRLVPWTVVGGLALSRASRRGYALALLCLGVRLVVDSIDISVDHRNRTLGPAWAFDLLLVVYLLFRLRALKR